MLPKKNRLVGPAIAATLLFAALVVAGLQAVTSPATAATQPADASRCWHTFLSPRATAGYETYNGVAGLSANDIWAVGMRTAGNVNGQPRNLIAHWDGSAWREVPSPGTGQDSDRLNDVAVVAPDDVWAVGEYYTGPGDAEKTSTLIMHWDGKEWSIVGSPSPADKLNSLLSIAAASSKDIWAVGFSGNISEPIQPLILHWDGVAWSQVATPTIPAPPQAAANSLETGQLLDVSVIRNDDVWAVGSGTGGRALALHWDGKTWSLVDTEAQGALQSVGGVAANDLWALGISQAGAQALHWDGSRWNKVPLPAPSAIITVLHGLAVLGRDDVWVAGYFYPAPNSPAQALVMRWDGKEWVQQERPPVQALGMQLEAAAAVQGNLWVVGHAATGKGFQVVGLLARHTGAPCASPLPTHAVPLYPPAPLPGSNSRTFTETGYTVSGIFLDYWQRNGGLSQHGYPIFNVMGEVSPLNGSLYTVQYFERAVLEYHPANLPPYDVLLSQLGTFEYKKRYSKGAPNQQRNMGRGSLYFPETGKWLGGEFLEFWQANGGLAQQGYPITDEFTETSALNGQQYRVQYFERSVMELHPENAPPHNVLLAQLGRFRYDELYGPARATGSPPTDQLVARNVMGRVVANDRYLFWIANTPPNFPIHGFDIRENRSFLVTDAGGYKYDLACDNSALAWVEMNKDAYPPASGRPVPVRIMKFEPARGKVSIVREGRTSDQIPEGRAAVRDWMLYYNERSGGIRAQSLSTGHEYFFLADAHDPVVSGDIVLWSRRLPECLPGGRTMCIGAQELYLTKGTQDTLLAKIKGQFTFEQYAVHDDKVVWTNSPVWGAGAPPQLHSLSTGTTITMSQQLARFPVVRDDLILWGSAPAAGKDWSIDRYYPASGAITVLLQSATPMYPQAFIGREALAYIAGKESPKAGYRTTGDLYLLRLGP